MLVHGNDNDDIHACIYGLKKKTLKTDEKENIYVNYINTWYTTTHMCAHYVHS